MVYRRTRRRRLKGGTPRTRKTKTMSKRHVKAMPIRIGKPSRRYTVQKKGELGWLGSQRRNAVQGAARGEVTKSSSRSRSRGR